MTTTARTALLRSPAFLGHDTGDHPEHPSRIAAIDAELERSGVAVDRPAIPFGRASFAAVARVHEPRYVDTLTEISHNGGSWLDPDTWCGYDSLDTAMLAAGAAIAAVDASLDGVASRSFALVRPPGHHATRARGMGFCLINNIAVAAEHALTRGLERVLVFDWDVHHGNGTQDIFYRSNNVLFVSMHQYGHHFYPGTGAADETGAGEGEGFTINLPLDHGRSDSDYIRHYDDLLDARIRAYSPELVLISAGFDAHIADPIGDMRMTERGFTELTLRLATIANASADGRMVAILEGGYDPGALARSVRAVLQTLDSDQSGMYDANDAPESRFFAGEEIEPPQ